MTTTGWILYAAIMASLMGLAYFLGDVYHRVQILEAEKQERVRLLTDPSLIDAELERSARRREAYDSGMPYPPRDDSGPPAVIRQARAPRFNSAFVGRKQRYYPKPKKDG